MKQRQKTKIEGGRNLSKKNIEERLSDYIDALNIESEPKIEEAENDRELEKLIETVHLVRSMKEPTMPDEAYPKRLGKTVADEIQKGKTKDH